MSNGHGGRDAGTVPEPVTSIGIPRRAQHVQVRLGMNVPGNDDRQFVLNVLHWLSGALQ